MVKLRVLKGRQGVKVLIAQMRVVERVFRHVALDRRFLEIRKGGKDKGEGGKDKGRGESIRGMGESKRGDRKG